MGDGSSHRGVPRYQLILPVRYSITDRQATRVGVGWTRDLSERGACLELPGSLSVGTGLTAVLHVGATRLSLEAQVVWTGHPGVPGGGTLHGVVFTEMMPELRHVLGALLKSKGRERPTPSRLSAALPLVCCPLGNSGTPLQGWTGDISHGGCLALLPEPLSVGTLVKALLTVPRGGVTAEAIIMWVEPSEQKPARQLLRHGLRFTDPSVGRDLVAALTPKVPFEDEQALRMAL